MTDQTLWVSKGYTFVYDDGEASTYFPTYREASPADILAAVRRIEGVEPDYEAAARAEYGGGWWELELDEQNELIEDIVPIVNAALAGRLVVPVSREEPKTPLDYVD